MLKNVPTVRLSRRQAVGLGAGLATAAIWSSATNATAASTAGRRTWDRSATANGWPVVGHATRHKIEGAANLSVLLLPGDVATVLSYVARRYAYEIDMLRPGDLEGHVTDLRIGVDFESNYLSGTALAIRPLFYPLGAQKGTGMTDQQKIIVRDILTDCSGVVVWGGELNPAKESHFQIGVPPTDGRLEALARRIQRWEQTPGRGAGTINAFDPARIRNAQKARG